MDDNALIIAWSNAALAIWIWRALSLPRGPSLGIARTRSARIRFCAAGTICPVLAVTPRNSKRAQPLTVSKQSNRYMFRKRYEEERSEQFMIEYVE